MCTYSSVAQNHEPTTKEGQRPWHATTWPPLWGSHLETTATLYALCPSSTSPHKCILKLT